ncbi:MAG: hypothetical protein ACC628_23080 [Pirellulaceae bacterium]
MIQFQAPHAHVVESVHGQVVERSSESNVAILSREGHAGGSSQFLAAPVFGEQLQSACLQVKPIYEER